jgi:hypothetical protein
MSRILANSLAALVAVIFATGTIGAVVDVPPAHAASAAALDLPVLA